MAGAVYFIRDELRPEFTDEIKQSGARPAEIHPDIFWANDDVRLYWVLDYWPGAERLNFDSINDAAKKLRGIGRHWAYAGGAHFRRGQLIAEALKVKKQKTLEFTSDAVYPTGGAFTLENEKSLIYTLKPLKRHFVGGKIAFVEDKAGPPSRAYLKLWETLTLTGIYPAKDEHVLDLGATPGGWSYVAASLGSQVTMIDRSAPDAKLMKKFPRLKFIAGDGLHPASALLETASVILSDMACEPAKLLHSVRAWAELPKIRAMICTLKIHGTSDKKIIADFARIPGSEIYHLWHNGHELTWAWLRNVPT
jgi:23S rRNA (cytidine2498-2'-O)-methyltransferase